MKISYSLGSLLSVQDVLACAQKAADARPDTIWIPETWGMENFAMLSAVSQKTSSNIGSSIINIFSRSPALIAMGAATVDAISNQRLILGLGTSSMPIVENLHGYKFQMPLARMRECIEIIRLVLSGKKIDYEGKIFSLKGFALLIKPPRQNIPIYIAAINQKMVDLAWEVADGTIFYLRPISEMKETIARRQSGRAIEVACQFITSVSQDEQIAQERAKKTLAFYISVGEIYREFLARNGFSEETKAIYNEYLRSGLRSTHEMVTEKMLQELAICGTPETCRRQLARAYDAGVTNPIIQFNPVGDVSESFDLLLETFSER